jgi:hypothetical protein
MDQMKITQVQTTKIMNDPMDASTDFETSEKILTTEITNSQIFEYSKKLEEQIKFYQAYWNKENKQNKKK